MAGLVPAIHVFVEASLSSKTWMPATFAAKTRFALCPGMTRTQMSPRSATLIGLTAILMWSLLAVLTVATGKIPAFQLAAMTFAIGALVGSLTWIGQPDAVSKLWQPPLAWIVGVGGLFGYHALYFLALRFAPPAEAGLLNYLWPLLIVLFSSLLPGERLAPHHI